MVRGIEREGKKKGFARFCMCSGENIGKNGTDGIKSMMYVVPVEWNNLILFQKSFGGEGRSEEERAPS